MKTLHSYITWSFVLAFLISLGVFTLIMIMGVVFRVTDLLARGVAWQPIMRIFVSGLPSALTFSIPISALTTSLLLFGRLSGDSEITAMKAGGVGMWRILAGPIWFAVLLSMVCVYINSDLSPRSHYARRKLVSQLGVQSPVELLQEGRFIHDFPGMIIYVGRRSGERLKNVRIYDMRTQGVRREIRAESGVIRPCDDGDDVILDLFDVRIDPFQDDRPGPAFSGKWSVRIKNAISSRIYTARQDDWSTAELYRRIRHIDEYSSGLDRDDRRRERTSLAVEMNKRLALSLSCFAFVLLGAPLGVKAHRKESSIGIGISLFLVFNFYLFVIIAETLKEHPRAMPNLIVWLPVIISIAGGTWLVHRSQ